VFVAFSFGAGSAFAGCNSGNVANTESPSNLVLVQNWDQELKRLVPTR